ncbi:hypothetical protein [Rhodococcus opacus]|uniref:hypothetical protein n=1 Tax=Rhodococcus opacus TaxID=37919 RepID=UPI00294A4D64|nr:hypothetical protein [Rhodococcus opacus]MDV6247497.1 hypothetical protein [Rhodococcus opacus]
MSIAPVLQDRLRLPVDRLRAGIQGREAPDDARRRLGNRQEFEVPIVITSLGALAAGPQDSLRFEDGQIEELLQLDWSERPLHRTTVVGLHMSSPIELSDYL